jgi:hypothetical protein
LCVTRSLFLSQIAVTVVKVLTPARAAPQVLRDFAFCEKKGNLNCTTTTTTTFFPDKKRTAAAEQLQQQREPTTTTAAAEKETSSIIVSEMSEAGSHSFASWLQIFPIAVFLKYYSCQYFKIRNCFLKIIGTIILQANLFCCTHSC